MLISSRNGHSESPVWLKRHTVPWLLNPATIYVVVSAVSLLAAARVSAYTWYETTKRDGPPTWYVSTLGFLVLASLLGWLVAYYWRSYRSKFQSGPDTHGVQLSPERLAAATRFCGAVVVCAYGLWLVLALYRGMTPGVAIAVLQGDPLALRASRWAMSPVGGVTSLVALGVPVAALYASNAFRLRRTDWFIICVIGMGSLTRMFLNAERLALIEVLIPAAFIFAVSGTRWGPIKRVLTVIIGGALSVAAIFALGEFRRPNYVVGARSENFGGYLGDRIGGYYLSAISNGYHYDSLVSSHPAPAYAADAFWKFPMVSHFVTPSSMYGMDSRQEFLAMLRMQLNPELNTIYTPAVLGAEMGFWIALMISFVFTLAIASICSDISISNAPGVAACGILCVAALESVRYPYIVQSRCLLALVACWGIYRWAKTSEARSPQETVAESRCEA